MQSFQHMKGYEVIYTIISLQCSKCHFKLYLTECLSDWDHNELVPLGAKHHVFIPLDSMKAVQSNDHSVLSS